MKEISFLICYGIIWIAVSIAIYVGIYKHQGRKPTTLEWWDECRLID